jgi:AbrB family looped-hinge helix DNA binding protein
MTTVLSPNGQIALPAPDTKKLNLSPGDNFEVTIEDDETVILRCIAPPANRGLVETELDRFKKQYPADLRGK